MTVENVMTVIYKMNNRGTNLEFIKYLHKHSSLKHLKILKSAENEPSDVSKNELLIQKY